MSVRSLRLNFKTSRLRLRTLQPGDQEFLASLDSDPVVMQYIHSGALSPQVALDWAESQVEMAPRRWHLHKWIAELPRQQIRIGWIELAKFHGVFDPDESRMSDDVSLGYEFASAYWGHGYAAEAARPVLEYAFETLELDRVVAFVHAANTRSMRVLTKLGFVQNPNSTHRDEGRNECLLYALTKEGWQC